MATERIGTMPNFPYSKATLACWRLIQQLRRSDVEAAAGVANVLDACSTARPCWSAACPVCGAAFQEVMVAIGDQYIRTLARSVSNRAHALVIVQSTGALLSAIWGLGCSTGGGCTGSMKGLTASVCGASAGPATALNEATTDVAELRMALAKIKLKLQMFLA